MPISGSRTDRSILTHPGARSVAAALVMLAGVTCRDVPTQPRIPSGGGASFAQSPQDLRITPGVDTIFLGQSLDLGVTSSNGTAINKQAVWTSSDTTIA